MVVDERMLLRHLFCSPPHMTTRPKEKKVEAYAMMHGDSPVLDTMLNGQFWPFILSNRTRLKRLAREFAMDEDDYRVVPCTIIYALPKPNKRKTR